MNCKLTAHNEAIGILGRAWSQSTDVYGSTIVLHAAQRLCGIKPDAECTCENNGDYCDVCDETIEIMDKWECLSPVCGHLVRDERSGRCENCMLPAEVL